MYDRYLILDQWRKNKQVFIKGRGAKIIDRSESSVSIFSESNSFLKETQPKITKVPKRSFGQDDGTLLETPDTKDTVSVCPDEETRRDEVSGERPDDWRT